MVLIPRSERDVKLVDDKMDDSLKEFQVEYSVRAAQPISGNFPLVGNPFDRENIIKRIAQHIFQETGSVVNWSQTLGVTYRISESARLLDSPWDSHLNVEVTAQEAVIITTDSSLDEGKIEKMREMYRQGDG